MRTVGELQAAYEETREPLKGLVKAMEELRTALDARKKSYDERMRFLLRAKPSLTREQCLKDIKALRKKYNEHRNPTRHFKQLWDDHEQLYWDFEKFIDDMFFAQEQLPRCKYMEEIEGNRTETKLTIAGYEFSYEKRVYPYLQQQVLDNSKLFQQQVRVLVQKMEDKEELLREITESLNEPLLQTVKTVERPKVDIDASSDLPAEIMALIFSHLTLESAVALRQVSRAWYGCFKYNEHVVEEATKNRLLGSNQSALVVSSRLSTWTEVKYRMGDLQGRNPVFFPRSGKWTMEDVDKNIHLKYVPCQTIVAIETKRLPADFCTLYNVWHSLDQRYAMDPSRLVFKRSKIWSPDYYEFGVQRLTDGSFKVTVQDWVVVLPEFLADISQMKSNTDTFVGIDHVAERAYVVSRQFPDYRDGHGFEIDYELAEELRGTQETPLYVPFARAGETQVLDTANKRLLTLCSVLSEFCYRIVAQYKGVLWVTIKYNRVLVPFIADLQTGKCYYQMDKAIHVLVRGDDWTLWTQCSGGMERFLYRQPEDEMQVVELLDLETRTVTRVQGEGELFAGFSNGKLGAWSMSKETLDGYENELDRLIGDTLEENQQEEYDVSGVEMN